MTLQTEIRDNGEPGSHLYTDAWTSYRGLGGEYNHEVIDHAVEYVHDAVHKNGIENFWSLLKRTIKGTYVSVEPFHLGRYLDEPSASARAKITAMAVSNPCYHQFPTGG